MSDTRPFHLSSNYRVFADGRVENRAWRGPEPKHGPPREERWIPVISGINEKGYPYFTPKIASRFRPYPIHLAVIHAWKGPPPVAGLICRHLDDDKLNMHIDNLEWGTHQENVDDRLANWKSRGERFKGSDHLTWEHIEAIQREHAKLKTPHAVLAKRYGVKPSRIAGIIKQKTNPFPRHHLRKEPRSIPISATPTKSGRPRNRWIDRLREAG